MHCGKHVLKHTPIPIYLTELLIFFANSLLMFYFCGVISLKTKYKQMKAMPQNTTKTAGRTPVLLLSVIVIACFSSCNNNKRKDG